MRMKTLSLVRAFIRKLPKGKPFTTREVLSLGLRAAIDQILSRMVKSGFIRRLARGVFVRDHDSPMTYSLETIAKLKCESFQRLMVRHEKAIFRDILHAREFM